MANKDAPFGLRPIGNTVGSSSDFQTTEYQIKDNQSNSIFQGDIVEIDTSNAGFVDVQAAVSNEDAIGVFNGCFIESDPSTGKPKFSNFYSQTNITQGAIKAFVFDNPYQRFLIQGDSATAAAQADIGKVADTVATHSGSTTTGISGLELDVSDLATTDGQLKALGFTGDPQNNELAVHANYIVAFNEHAHKTQL